MSSDPGPHHLARVDPLLRALGYNPARAASIVTYCWLWGTAECHANEVGARNPDTKLGRLLSACPLASVRDSQADNRLPTDLGCSLMPQLAALLVREDPLPGLRIEHDIDNLLLMKDADVMIPIV